MKKTISLVIALMLILALSASAFAAEPSPEPTPSKNPLDSIDIPRSLQREIYDDYEQLYKTMDKRDGETIFAFQDRVAAQIAEKYGVAAEDVSEIYSYGLVGYLYDFEPYALPLTYGRKMDAFIAGTKLVIMAKVELQLTAKLTVTQNYFNVCDLIQKQGCGELHTIEYSAYVDGSNGNEIKIISFTLERDVIETIAQLDYAPVSILDQFVTKLWIHRDLQ